MADVSHLSDDELYQQLKYYGINSGPITATTRHLYEKKLGNYLKSMNNTIKHQSAPVTVSQSSTSPSSKIQVNRTFTNESTSSGFKPKSQMSIITDELPDIIEIKTRPTRAQESFTQQNEYEYERIDEDTQRFYERDDRKPIPVKHNVPIEFKLLNDHDDDKYKYDRDNNYRPSKQRSPLDENSPPFSVTSRKPRDYHDLNDKDFRHSSSPSYARNPLRTSTQPPINNQQIKAKASFNWQNYMYVAIVTVIAFIFFSLMMRDTNPKNPVIDYD